MTVSMPLTEAAEPPLWQMPTRVPCEAYSRAMRSRSSTDTPVISAYSSMVYSFTVSVRSEKPVRTATPFTSPSNSSVPLLHAECSAGCPVAASMTTYCSTALPSLSFSSGASMPASAARMSLR